MKVEGSKDARRSDVKDFVTASVMSAIIKFQEIADWCVVQLTYL